MTIGEIKEILPEVSSKQRQGLMDRLLRKFSPVSIDVLVDFQHKWDGSKTFHEFTEAQNKVVIQCIDLECDEPGHSVRRALGLEPISLKTVV